MNKKLLIGIIAGICVVALVLGLVLGFSNCQGPNQEPTGNPTEELTDPPEPDYTDPEPTIPVVEGGISYYSGRPDYGWYDPTSGNKEYILYTADQLYGFAELVNTMGLKFEGVTIKLANNMVINEGDASQWTRYDFQLPWVPLGKSWTAAFSGTIDGQGHYISGLFSVQPKNNGFIAYSQGATVKNLAIVNSYFCNTNEGDAQAEVMATFVGRGRGVTLQNLYSDAILENGGYSTGGIVAYTQNTWDNVNKACVVDSCVFAGQIKNSIGKGTGGILGHDNGSKYAVTVQNCLFIGTLDSKNANCGGIVGQFSGSSKMINCVSAGKVTSTSKEFNGVALIGSAGGNSTISNSYFVSTKSGKAIGAGSPGTLEGVSGPVRATMKGMNAAKVLPGVDFDKVWTADAESYPIPTGVKAMYDLLKKPLAEDTSDDSNKPTVVGGGAVDVGNADISWYDETKTEFTISTIDQLYGFAKLVNEGKDFSGKTVKLGANLTINRGTASKWTKETTGLRGWAPIGTNSKQFKGTFDGQGHYISGLFSVQAKGNGLFGYAKDATIKNLAVVNSFFVNTGATSADTRSSGQGLAAFVAIGENVKLSGLYSNAVLKNAGTDLGGIIGYAKGSTTVDSCAFAGTILSEGFETRNYGGIVGYNERGVLTVSNCLFSGKMNTKTHLQGGIVGRSNINGTTIKNCVSVGEVKGGSANNSNNAIIGAVKAELENTTVTVENCYYITGSKTVHFLENVGDNVASVKETNVVKLDETAVKGEGVAAAMSKLDFKSKWSALKDYYPIPTAVKSVFQATYKAHAHEWATEWSSDGSYHWHVCIADDCDITDNAKKNGYGEHVYSDAQDETCNICNYKRTVFVDDGVPSVYTGTPDTSWYKDDANEFILTSADQLYGFAKLVNEGKDFAGKTVKLGKNMIINESKVDSWTSAAPNHKWTPIGAAKDKPFKGTFDGQGKFISGIYSVQKKHNALIAHAIGATVKNLAVIDSYFENTDYTGADASAKRVSSQNLSAFVAYGDGATLQNLYSNAWLHNGGENVGGIVGYAQKGTTVDSCMFAGLITNDADRDSWKIGGIVGFNNDGKISISNALFTGKINGKFHLVGGILGRSDVTGTSLDSCVSVGSVVSSSTNTINKNNGLIGALKNAKVDVKNSYYLTGYRVLGYGEGTGEAVVTDCTALDAAAMKGAAAAAAMTKLDFAAKWSALDKDYPVPTAVKAMYEAHKARHVCEFETEWTYDSEYHWHKCSDINCEEIKDKAAHNYGADGMADKCVDCGHKNPVSGNTGTPDTSWYNDESKANKVGYIMSEDQLLGLAKLVDAGTCNFKDWTIYLGKDLVMNEGDASTWNEDTQGLVKWTPIGENYDAKGFQGTFDGLGHTISGIWSVQPKNNALFSHTRNAVIKNLSVTNSYFQNTNDPGSNGWGNENMAVFVGRGQGIQLYNLYTDAILVNGGPNTGGICGYTQNGGVSGVTLNSCIIEGCVFDGVIRNANTGPVGGILGSDNGSNYSVLVKDCMFTGSIEISGANVGGIVGALNGASTVDGCISTGSVTSTSEGWSNVALVGKVTNKAEITNNRYQNVADVKKIGTGTPKTDTNNVGIGPVVFSAQKPTISTQPTGSVYEPNGAAVALKVVAEVADNGKLSYQWYKSTTSATDGFTAIDGATEASFVPALDEDAWYRCEVTSTNLYVGGNKTAGVTSEAVKIHIHAWDSEWNHDSINHFHACASCDEIKDKARHNSADGNDLCDICGSVIDLADAPVLNTLPAGPLNGGEVGSEVELFLGASVSDGGTLSYQWYSNTTNSNENGTPIAGATASTYKFTPSAAGNYYYYCVVTNTNAAEQINETVSGAVTVHVHGWESAWVNTDANNHWHECDIDACPVTENSGKNGYGAHNLVHNLCQCGYIGPVSYYDPALGQDTSWYDASKNEFVLSNANQLYGLAKLVNGGTSKFEGKTITLGCNMVINQGDASTWTASNTTLTKWSPIGTSWTNVFKGILDGDGHFISGVFSVQTKNNAFFCYTQNATVKNLSIINSYFESTGGDNWNAEVQATFVGRGQGITLRNLYTDAILVGGGAHTGGICAYTQGEGALTNPTIDSCVFNGVIRNATGDGVGGILGGDNNKKYVTITNCLNLGSVSSSRICGGIVGYLHHTSKMESCINIGAVTSTNATYNGAALIGSIKASTVEVKNCYYDSVNNTKAIGTGSGNVVNVEPKTSAELKGTVLTGLNAWSVVANEYPIPTGVKGMMDDLNNVQTATTPVISTQPQGGQYNVGNTAAALTVEATGDATGLLSYQWYKSTISALDGFTAIEGATGASYTPDTAAAGNVWYYCKVTNTNSIFGGKSTKDSGAALIHIHDWDETKYGSNAEYHWNNECKLANHETVTEPAKMGNYEPHTAFGNHICSDCGFVAAVSYYDASKGADKSFYNAATYASTNEFYLTNANQLFGFAELVNGGVTFQGKTVYLNVNVVINEGDAKTWTPSTTGLTNWKVIGINWTQYFGGVFDGKGHYISGIYSKQAKNNAFMCYTQDATIRNVAIVNSYFTNTGDSQTNAEILATFVGRGRGVMLNNLYTDAILESGNVVGGIVGYTQSGTWNAGQRNCVVDSCVFAGEFKHTTTVYTAQQVGGIVGHSNGQVVTIQNCLFSGKISGKNNAVGGIIGRIYVNSSSVKNCVSSGDVSSTYTPTGVVPGAVIGYVQDFDVVAENCYYNNALNLLGWKKANTGKTASVTEVNCAGMAKAEMTGMEVMTTKMPTLDAAKWTATAGYPVPTGIKEIFSEKALFEAKRDQQN